MFEGSPCLSCLLKSELFEGDPCGDDDVKMDGWFWRWLDAGPVLSSFNARRLSRSCLVVGACSGLFGVVRRRPLRLSEVEATSVVVDGEVGVALAEA